MRFCRVIPRVYIYPRTACIKCKNCIDLTDSERIHTYSIETKSAQKESVLETRVRAENLLSFFVKALCAVGVPDADAHFAAETFVSEELRIGNAYGLLGFLLSVRRIRAGEITASPKIQIMKEDWATALFDGGNGLGQLVSKRAMERAIFLAGRYGVGVAGVRGSHHFGAAFHYAEMATAHGMIGIASSVANRNAIAPWGGLDKLIGNNPIAIAVPSGTGEPIVLDMASGVVAQRKIVARKINKQTIPLGWATDSSGESTEDPNIALDGLLNPLGGHKGAGLGFMLGILCGALTGAHFGKDVDNSNVGHLFIALRVGSFRDEKSFRQAVSGAVAHVRQSRKKSSVTRLPVPGEEGFRRMREKKQYGIPVSPAFLGALRKAAEELGIGFLPKTQ